MPEDHKWHKFIPLLQAMKIPDAKAAADKEWKKLETIPAVGQSEEYKAGFSGSTKRQKEATISD